MLEVAGRSRDEVGDTQRQYTSTGTVDTGTREIGVQRHLEKGGVGPCQTLTQVVSGLVEKWDCVVHVKNRRQLLCKELSSSSYCTHREVSAAQAQSE